MARLNQPAGLASRPSSVALGELAIAAGLVGQPLALNFRDFPAMISCELWRYFTEGVGLGQVLRVCTRKDLKDLNEMLAVLRIVIVQTDSLCREVSWAIQLADASQPRPAVLLSSAAYAAEDDPGAVLSVVCTERETASVIDWLAGGTSVDACGCELNTPTSVQYDPRIEALFARMSGQPTDRLAKLRQLRILRSLLAGACVLRSSHPEHEVPPTDVVGLQDYELVRALLCSLVAETSSAAQDLLADDMINRANVYLSISYAHSNSLTEAELERLAYLDKYGGNPSRRELITRRELTDLGNVRSATVIRLVEQLQRSDRGRSEFLRMGIAGPPVSDRVWRQSSARELARRLRPWSQKQVRLHFDRLRRDGLITAERDSSNGPWRFEVPEGLGDASSPFADLPTAEQLAADNAAA